MLKGKILAAVTAVCMVLGMTACEKDDQTAQAAMEDLKQINWWADINAEISMPDGWTNEDFFNFFVINGKTLTQPTTLNELMEFDDKFTYEVTAYLDDTGVIGPVYDYKHEKCFLVNVLYNNKNIFSTHIYSEENDEKAMLDLPMGVFIFDKDLCRDAGLDVATACGLDYNSTYDDMEKIFGVLTADPLISNRFKYQFNDDEYLYVLFFYINEESGKIETFHVGMYSLDQPIEKE